MKLIIGLGNPGPAYANSRHNIGFLVIDALAKSCKAKLKKPFGSRYLSAKVEIGAKPVILAQPLTYMNLSGSAVKALLKKHKAALEDILVVCDDLDLELGRLKIKADGASGGHRGLESIINYFGSRQFSRLRIGINRPAGNMDAAEYVLLPFKNNEKKAVDLAVNRACECAAAWAGQGIEKIMNQFNRRSQSNE